MLEDDITACLFAVQCKICTTDKTVARLSPRYIQHIKCWVDSTAMCALQCSHHICGDKRRCTRGVFQQLFAAGALCQTSVSPCAILAYAYCHLTAAYLQQRLSACNCLLPRVPSYVGYTNAHCRLVTLSFCLLGTADLPSHVCPLVVFAASVMVDPCVATCSLLDHPMVALSKLHERCSIRSFVWSCAAIADMTQPTQKTFDRLENHTCISTLPTTLWP